MNAGDLFWLMFSIGSCCVVAWLFGDSHGYEKGFKHGIELGESFGRVQGKLEAQEIEGDD